MKIAVLGTGQVGQVIAGKLASLGHEVRMGSRTPDNSSASTWAADNGDRASHGTFADAAAFGEVVFNCTAGAHVMAVLEAAGTDNLAGKVLVDLANPLDFSQGFPPRLTVCNDDSIGEQIQRAFPAARVVKTLNMMANPIMVDPASLGEPTDILLCGDDSAAKEVVIGLLREFGWTDPIDLGPIGQARGMEMWLPLWVRLYGKLGTGDFNIRIVRKTAEAP